MRLGTRGSALALAQARHVARLLADAHVNTEVCALPTTSPAERADETTAREGGPALRAHAPVANEKSRWVQALERALIDHEIDLAVHSAKDVPEELPAGLALLGAPARGPAEDVICGYPALEALPRGARVGTSSLRRAAQLHAAREDLAVVPVSGNVDTRLAKLRAGADRIDALVLARAGLARLGRLDAAGGALDPERFVPAPGQGTLVLQGRVEDEPAHAAVGRIAEPTAVACLLAERALARALGASCRTPLGAHGQSARDGSLRLRAWVGLPDGSHWIADSLSGSLAEPEALGQALAVRMQAAGADDLLREADDVALAGRPR
jgi:hydroxymethylbilane synthase